MALLAIAKALNIFLTLFLTILSLVLLPLILIIILASTACLQLWPLYRYNSDFNLGLRIRVFDLGAFPTIDSKVSSIWFISLSPKY